MNIDRAKEYIDVLLDAALRITEGDRLAVLLPAKHRSFGEALKTRAMELGAVKVGLSYLDEEGSCEYYAAGHTDAFQWINKEDYDDIVDAGGKLLLLPSPEFGLEKRLTPEQNDIKQQHDMEDMRYRISKYMRDGKVISTMGMLPNTSWAEVVFPGLKGDEAEKALWHAMKVAMYLDEPDPCEVWKQRAEMITARGDYLDAMQFDAIHITGEGTDLMLPMPEGHKWTGGNVRGEDGSIHIGAIPTEETFTAPHCEKAYGHMNIVSSSYLDNQRTDAIRLSFENGRVKELVSENPQFAEALNKHIYGEPNGDRLGEIAIVTGDSGVRASGTYFYHNIFDENAKCHFAFGNSYRFSILGSAGMTDGEYAAKGGNICNFHFDIPFDSENMNIYGIKDGKSTLILEKGVWKA